MSRVSLPGAAELFSTAPVLSTQPAAPVSNPPAPKGTPRSNHDEKITVYLSSQELLDLETARLSLRGVHKIATDRGRIVRAAIALAIADLEQNGQNSTLYKSLKGE